MSRLFWFVSLVGCLVLVPEAAAQVANGSGNTLPKQSGQIPISQLPFNQRALAASATVPAARPAGQPSWHPLPLDQDKYLMEILNYWEFQATQVQRYRCKFWRHEYDPIKLPHDPDIAAIASQGTIQYAAPDKGLFHVEKVWDAAMDTQKVTDPQTGVERQVSRPAVKDGKQQWVQRAEVFDEHWICDGKSIFEMNGRNKQIIERRLPAEMQGKQITQGPLPFLFGAKAATMREQYWIRVTLPPPKPGKFMLEAIPKRQAEAADFKEIRIVIDEKEFLPEALLLFHRGGGRSNYEFQEREKNWNILPEKLNPFHQQFFAPKPPTGWKMVLEPFEPAPAANPAPPAAIGGNGMPPRQAIRPMPVQTKR